MFFNHIVIFLELELLRSAARFIARIVARSISQKL